MARSLGPVLPDALVARLAAPDAGAHLEDVIVLATVDPYGWPHPALLSYAEVLALDASRLRIALYEGTRSTRQLRDSARATLVFADPDLTLYVKAEALPLPPVRGDADLARFELLVRDVLEDRAEGEEAGARLTGGIRAAWPGGPEGATRRRTRLRAALSA